MASGKKRKKNKVIKQDNDRNKNKEKITVSDRKQSKGIRYREFPGTDNVNVVLRVAFDIEAYADFIIHARSSLDAEICGVLAGNVYEDEEGIYIHIHAIIQGNAAQENTTHVTFTQETWNNIHNTLENNYPGYQILGWYHSHPGFGVEFSDMDYFIQENFFPLPTQIGLLTDPLRGDISICVNMIKETISVQDTGGEAKDKVKSQKEITYLDKFWVDGRLVHCYTPYRESEETGSVSRSSTLQRFENLETRFNQFLEKLDSQRRLFYSIIMGIGMIILTVVLIFIGFNVYRSFAFDNMEHMTRDNSGSGPLVIRIEDELKVIGEKPVSIPIQTQIDDKIIYLDIILHGWVFDTHLNQDEEEKR